MTKKITTICFFILFSIILTSNALAQRGIDPDLQPKNIPGIPSTGSNCPIDQIDTTTKKATCKDSKVDADCVSKTYDPTTGYCLGAEDEPIVAFLQILAGALLMISGSLAVIMISIGGLMYIKAHGNDDQLGKAKNTILYGILGSLVIIFSFFIVRVIIATLIQQTLV